MTPDFTAERRTRWLAAAALAIVVALVYGNSLRAPFLFDDIGAVVNNPTLRELTSFAVLNPPRDGSTTTGRPIVNLSFALNYALSVENVWSYHLFNIALHALAAITLMGIVRRTLLRERARPVRSPLAPRGSPPARQAAAASAARRTGDAPAMTQASTIAFFAALVFALHPLQTESVVCIAQRTEVLCGVFYLLTLYGFIRGCERREGKTGSAHRRWFGVSVAACLLGMGTKEVMVTAPLLVLLYDRTFVSGTFGGALRSRGAFHGALACTWIPLALLVAQGGGSRGASAGFGLGVTWWTYLLKQADAAVLYLRLSFWPHPLVLDYGTGVAHSFADVWWQGTIVLALLATTVWALVRRPIAGFFGSAFFLILAPSSSIIPLVTQSVAEHRMYLPLASLVTALVAGASLRFGRHATWPLAAVGLVLAVATVARIDDYRTVVSIWSDTIAKVPDNARAHNNLAWALQHEGKPAQANAHFARAVELQPDYVSAWYNRAVALLEQGRAVDAVERLAAAVRLAPLHADAHVNLGNALTQAQRTAEALPHYEATLRIKPAADVHYNLGLALDSLRRTGEAEDHFRAALRLKPQLHEAHFQLGRIAERAGRMAEAESHYSEVLRLAPEHAAAHARLGLLLARTERLEPAAEHFRAAIRLQPGDADAHANLGNVLLLQSRPREALASYEEALRLRPNDPRTRENIELARQAMR
jgi:tetratricopeptide (TPR) repeat protein